MKPRLDSLECNAVVFLRVLRFSTVYYLQQLWARYLEGSNISIKIGSCRDRNGHTDFLTNRDRGGQPDLSRNSGHVGMPYPEFSSIIPGRFRSKKSRQVRENRGKSGTILTIPDSPQKFWKIGMAISTYPDTSGKIKMAISTYPQVSGWVGRLKNPNLDVGSRSGWPPQLILPIVANHRTMIKSNPKIKTAFTQKLLWWWRSAITRIWLMCP